MLRQQPYPVGPSCPSACAMSVVLCVWKLDRVLKVDIPRRSGPRRAPWRGEGPLPPGVAPQWALLWGAPGPWLGARRFGCRAQHHAPAPRRRRRAILGGPPALARRAVAVARGARDPRCVSSWPLLLKVDRLCLTRGPSPEALVPRRIAPPSGRTLSCAYRSGFGVFNVFINLGVKRAARE